MSDAGRWRKVEEIFNRALDQPEEQRDEWLISVCAGDRGLYLEVRSLLDSDRAAAGAFVGAQVGRAVIELKTEVENHDLGRRAGPYRLIRELGRGGMGAVYLAVRDDEHYESEVAIKLVRPGLDTDFILRRFRRERQILARLEHANIARLLDGGTAEDGTPYFVMEYISGARITAYAAEHGLSVEQRLRLFLPVCAAVEYAHHHFIVHRDIKPGNILVGRDGVPKLLDFGISKILIAGEGDGSDTNTMGMMTPQYASPEQVLGNPVTIASDIYSLGAVLYELLTNVRPHQIDSCTPLALERAICLEELRPPSMAAGDRGLSRRLRGDLDNIVLRAMQTLPERRYESVSQLAEDIQRHLHHQPVVARPDSLSYRAGKFFRRHRVAVSFGSLAMFSLIAGAALTVREARIAEERFNDVRHLATAFVFDVEQAARPLPGSRPLRDLITRTGIQYLDGLSRSSANDWTLKRELAAAYLRIGELQGGVESSNLGDETGAVESYHHAEALLDEVLRHSPDDRKAATDRMTVTHRLGNVHRQMGQVAAAVQAEEDGLRRAEALLAKTPDDVEIAQYAAVFHLDLGRMRQQSGDLSKAAEEIEKAVRLLERVSAAHPGEMETLANIGSSYARMGAVQAELGRREEALESYRKGVAVGEEALHRFPNDTHARHELMLAYSHLGDILGNPAYDNFGDEPAARAAYLKMVESAKILYDADAGDVRAMSDYGIALLRLGIVSPKDGKRRVLEEAHDLLQRASARSPADNPTRTHRIWNEIELGDTSAASGDHAAAARYYRMAMSTAETGALKDQSDQERFVAAAFRLSQEQVRAGDRAAALAILEKAMGLANRIESDAPVNSVTIRSSIPAAWRARGALYAALAKREAGGEQRRDRNTARESYERALREWQKLESLPGFTGLRKKEMAAAATELAALAKEYGGVR